MKTTQSIAERSFFIDKPELALIIEALKGLFEAEESTLVYEKVGDHPIRPKDIEENKPTLKKLAEINELLADLEAELEEYK